jgi:hypothetical protein
LSIVAYFGGTHTKSSKHGVYRRSSNSPDAYSVPDCVLPRHIHLRFGLLVDEQYSMGGRNTLVPPAAVDAVIKSGMDPMAQ